jgi:hypothetical protein
MHYPTDNHKNHTRFRLNHFWAVLCTTSALMIGPHSLQAAEVSGVKIPDSVELEGQTLRLNGAGMRTKFFIDVYVIALYLAQTNVSDPADVLQMESPKRVAMHVIYDELDREKIVDAWMTGFKSNTSKEELAALMPAIEQFNAMWPALKSGDTATVDLVEPGEVRASVNNTPVGSVRAAGLPAAVLRIWLGDDPSDSDLKRRMLGGNLTAAQLSRD